MVDRHPHGRRVLIVDDENAPRTIEAIALEGTSRYQATQASNATDAVTMLADDEFDCAVVDLDMPDMSGDELIRMIRANRDRRDMPIVLVLPEVVNEIDDRDDHPGATRVIRKPFEPWDLAHMLDGLTGALDDGEHPLSVESVLRGFPYPAMILDEGHRVVLANGSFYHNTGTGIGECYVYCMEHLHEGGAVPGACPLEQSVRTGSPAEHTISTVLGVLRVSVYPLDADMGSGKRLYLHVTQPVG